MFRELNYQNRVLEILDCYIDRLKANKRDADEIRELAATKPHLNVPVPDFAEQAWEALKAEGKLPLSRAAISFSPRHDGCSHPVPNTVLKVPTGGGKTWLAISGVGSVKNLSHFFSGVIPVLIHAAE